MYKLLFITSAILLLLSACGGEPTPQERERQALLDKLQASHTDRFNRDGSHNKDERRKRKKSQTKRLDDPTAYIYKGAVLTKKEEKKWKKEGISNKEYPFWVRLKISPKEVSSWKKLAISKPAVSVLKKLKYTPKKARKFMDKKFFTRPIFYAQFGTPVYEFDSICKSVIQRQSPPFAFLEERCLPYMKDSHKNEGIGHLLDKAKLTKGPLALEYLAELRRLAEDNSKIQSGMEVTLEEFIEDEDEDNFVFLFPLLKNEPSQDEMDFIDTYKLPLQNEERFTSFQNPLYWEHRAEAKAAALALAARQEELLRTKKDKDRKLAQLKLLKAEALAKEKRRKEELFKKQQALKKAETSRRKKASKLCGEYINEEQFSGRAVLLEGKILFTVGKAGGKKFGYGVKARPDSKVYFIRDPKNIVQAEVRQTISWRVKTMGRTEALEKINNTNFTYNKKSSTKFTMALYTKKCEVK
ncbi:MAG: hypothetical protein COA44_02520 [Arcobacter sp.]|nr:MAG: hypothetical protein COA44_02520 [Arcobacter sp.]